MTTEHKIFSKDLVPSEQTAAFLQVEGLVKSYAPSDASVPPVFEAVNFDIQKGEFVCIIGHSGCGKSTILNIAPAARYTTTRSTTPFATTWLIFW